MTPNRKPGFPGPRLRPALKPEHDADGPQDELQGDAEHHRGGVARQAGADAAPTPMTDCTGTARLDAQCTRALEGVRHRRLSGGQRKGPREPFDQAGRAVELLCLGAPPGGRPACRKLLGRCGVLRRGLSSSEQRDYPSREEGDQPIEGSLETRRCTKGQTSPGAGVDRVGHIVVKRDPRFV
jgi:hypothetical protein